MTLYKLTYENHRTKNGMQWGENISNTATGEGTELCTDGVIHAYEHPLLAVLISPIHVIGNYNVLWAAEGEVVAREGHLKCGCKKLTTVVQVPLPSVTTTQRVAFGILCSLEVCHAPAFRSWAEKWLSGEDRSEKAAQEAAAAAGAAAQEAAAAAAAARAARAAAEAAWAAQEAAWAAQEAAWAARAARAAAEAGEAGEAWAAGVAAEAAVWAKKEIDLIALAEKAVREY